MKKYCVEIIELKNIITEKFNRGFSSRLEQMEESISELQKGSRIHPKRNKKKNEERKLLKGLKGHQRTNQYIHYRGPRRRDKGTESLFKEIMAENFPTLGKEKDIRHPDLRRSKMMNPKRPTPRHIIIKVSKLKTRKIFKVAREKQPVMYMRTHIRLLADFFQQKSCWLEVSGRIPTKC